MITKVATIILLAVMIGAAIPIVAADVEVGPGGVYFPDSKIFLSSGQTFTNLTALPTETLIYDNGSFINLSSDVATIISNLAFIDNEWSFTAEAPSGTFNIKAESSAGISYDLVVDSVIDSSAFGNGVVIFSYTGWSTHDFVIRGTNTSDPTNLASSTSNFWVNYTWSPGPGIITDSYNVSYNSTWDNSSSNAYKNTYVGPHGYVDIIVYGYNNTAGLSLNSLTDNVTVPNNLIILTDVSSSYSINEGDTLSIDANYTDLDLDVGVFTDNSSEWSINSGTGVVSWVTVDGDQGTYYQYINVADGYGSNSRIDFVVNVANSTPGEISNLQNTTGNFWINWTWDAGDNADDYDIKINTVDIGSDVTDLYYQHTASAHETATIDVRSNNHTLGSYSGTVSDTMTVPNNPIYITNTSDADIIEGETVSVDYDYTDADSDTGTFSCDRLDMFTNFNTGTGVGSWETDHADSGVYQVDFGVSDGYGSTDNYTMTITVTDAGSITIPNYSNTKTNDKDLEFPLQESETVTMNVTPSNLTGVHYHWYIDGVYQNHDYDNISALWLSWGDDAEIICYVNTTSLGSSPNLTWVPAIIVPRASGNADTVNTTRADEFVEGIEDFDVEQMVGAEMYLMTDLMGSLFFLLIIGVPFIMIWLRTESLVIPGGLGTILGGMLILFMPVQYQAAIGLVIIISIVSILVGIYKDRR